MEYADIVQWQNDTLVMCMLSVQVRLSAVCNETCAETNSRNGKQKLAFIAEENSSLDVTLKEHTWCLPGGGYIEDV